MNATALDLSAIGETVSKGVNARSCFRGNNLSLFEAKPLKLPR